MLGGCLVWGGGLSGEGGGEGRSGVGGTVSCRSRAV